VGAQDTGMRRLLRRYAAARSRRLEPGEMPDEMRRRIYRAAFAAYTGNAYRDDAPFEGQDFTMRDRHGLPRHGADGRPLRESFWAPERYFEKVVAGPWVFYGDAAMTGFVTVRPVPEHAGVYKLTSSGGNPHGVLCGIARLLADGVAVMGGVPDRLLRLALRHGFVTLDRRALEALIDRLDRNAWGRGRARPTITTDGQFRFEIPDQIDPVTGRLGRTVTKRFICTPAFEEWARSYLRTPVRPAAIVTRSVGAGDAT
jgi:hypothetical protein